MGKPRPDEIIKGVMSEEEYAVYTIRSAVEIPGKAPCYRITWPDGKSFKCRLYSVTPNQVAFECDERGRYMLQRQSIDKWARTGDYVIMGSGESDQFPRLLASQFEVVDTSIT
jgi:hypothetical protein